MICKPFIWLMLVMTVANLLVSLLDINKHLIQISFGMQQQQQHEQVEQIKQDGKQQQLHEQQNQQQQQHLVDDWNVHNTNWSNVQYVSNLFGKYPDIDEVVQKQCARQSGLKLKTDGLSNPYCVGPIETNYSCCYCYTFSYPNFMLEDEKKWIDHINHLGTYQNRNSYWFCAVPRETVLHQTTTWQTINSKSEIRVVTGKFGYNQPFKDEVQHVCERIRSTSLVKPENVFCLYESPDYVLNDKRFERHLRYRNDPNDISSKGGGYWIHKYIILRHYMDQFNENDIVIWIDRDRLDFFRHGSFETIVETFDNRNSDFMIESFGSAEWVYTKEDVLFAFNATTSTRRSLQMNANAWFIRNNQKMRHFLDEIITCMSYWHMLSDEESIIKNYDGFRDHRHDQSILSVFVKTYLTSQGVIGPPAQSFQPHGSTIRTFTLDDSTVQPICPFASFFEQQMASTS